MKKIFNIAGLFVIFFPGLCLAACMSLNLGSAEQKAAGVPVQNQSAAAPVRLVNLLVPEGESYVTTMSGCRLAATFAAANDVEEQLDEEQLDEDRLDEEQLDGEDQLLEIYADVVKFVQDRFEKHGVDPATTEIRIGHDMGFYACDLMQVAFDGKEAVFEMAPCVAAIIHCAQRLKGHSRLADFILGAYTTVIDHEIGHIKYFESIASNRLWIWKKRAVGCIEILLGGVCFVDHSSPRQAICRMLVNALRERKAADSQRDEAAADDYALLHSEDAQSCDAFAYYIDRLEASVYSFIVARAVQECKDCYSMAMISELFLKQDASNREFLEIELLAKNIYSQRASYVQKRWGVILFNYMMKKRFYDDEFYEWLMLLQPVTQNLVKKLFVRACSDKGSVNSHPCGFERAHKARQRAAELRAQGKDSMPARAYPACRTVRDVIKKLNTSSKRRAADKSEFTADVSQQSMDGSVEAKRVTIGDYTGYYFGKGADGTIVTSDTLELYNSTLRVWKITGDRVKKIECTVIPCVEEPNTSELICDSEEQMQAQWYLDLYQPQAKK